MSVLLEFAMFPTDKGSHVSESVSHVIATIRESGYPYQLTAMGTLIETESIEQATEMLNACYRVLAPDAERVYTSIKMDIRKGGGGRMQQKVEAVKKHIGDVNV